MLMAFAERKDKYSGILTLRHKISCDFQSLDHLKAIGKLSVPELMFEAISVSFKPFLRYTGQLMSFFFTYSLNDCLYYILYIVTAGEEYNLSKLKGKTQ